MKARLGYYQLMPDAMQAVDALDSYTQQCGLETSLMELVRLRASQLNGCAYCLDMHSKDARTKGETEQRLYGLNAWRESPFYSERERAALAFTEAVTLIAETHVPETIYTQAKKQFSDEELVNLTMVTVTINVWNRLAITFRSVPGSYQPKHFATLAHPAQTHPTQASADAS